jgi:hypothetical protein
MSQFYTDESRENETYALPDAETFYAKAGEWAHDKNGERCDVETYGMDHDRCGEPVDGQDLNSAGWYWLACLPGCLPDSDPHGPFETEEEAIEDAREDF